MNCVIGKGKCCSHVKGLAGRDLSRSLRLSQATATTTQMWMYNACREARVIALVWNISQSPGDFFFYAFQQAILFFYLAVAIKDLPLLLFSLFHHLFHHLISLLFSFEVTLFIPMRICIWWYKKERFRCTPLTLVNTWCNAKFLQICFEEETNSSISWMAWWAHLSTFSISGELLLWVDFLWSLRKPKFLLCFTLTNYVHFIHIHED